MLILLAMVKENVTFTNLRVGLVFAMKDTMDLAVLAVMLKLAIIMVSVRVMGSANVTQHSLEILVKERKPRGEILEVVINYSLK